MATQVKNGLPTTTQNETKAMKPALLLAVLSLMAAAFLHLPVLAQSIPPEPNKTCGIDPYEKPPSGNCSDECVVGPSCSGTQNGTAESCCISGTDSENCVMGVGTTSVDIFAYTCSSTGDGCPGSDRKCYWRKGDKQGEEDANNPTGSICSTQGDLCPGS